jgi:hypothetical protein
MKFYALLPVRDEDDIILETLKALSEWADGIFILDTGSVDNTWKLINEYSKTCSKILWKQQLPVYYTESAVRGLLFNVARKFMKEGDWFLRVDADEFHDISPRIIVSKHLQTFESVVWHQYFNFELLMNEVDNLQDQYAILKERTRPISQRRCWYTISEYSEPRMFKYRKSMKWPDVRSQPFNGGIRAKVRLPIRHYPHRDPLQLRKRCLLRSLTMKTEIGNQEWASPDYHWRIDDWCKLLVEPQSKDLYRLTDDASLPLTFFPLDSKVLIKRSLLRLFYRFFVYYTDQFRPGWMGSEKLIHLPESFQVNVQSGYKLLQEG